MTPEGAKALADAGPWAVVIFFVSVVAIVVARAFLILWREHLKADQDDRDERNRANDLLALSLANNKAAIAAWDRRTAADAARRRKEDA